MVKRWSVIGALMLCTVTVVAEAKNRKAEVIDAAGRQHLVDSLRGRGPARFAEALAKYDELEAKRDQFARQINEGDSPRDLEKRWEQIEQQIEEWRQVVDQVGGQRSCTVSRLYWYTELAAAQAEAVRTGRPILSLRMLGKLTDQFSCANSRFFRTALYSNRDISDYLRDHFVLHWQSVRPVPRVTIDFGDGRKLERTLTGNSAHYVLASDGTPLDVLPGLYSPHEFQASLGRLEQFHRDYLATAEAERAKKLADFHSERRQQVHRQWAGDIQQLGEQPATLVATRIEQAIEMAHLTGSKSPLATAAARIAATKLAAESALLRYANFSGPWIESGMDDELWQAIANLHREKVKLDDASVAVMRQEFPQAEVAGRVSVTKSRQEDPILRVVRAFEDSIALDTVRNEYLLHRQIHERFAEGDAMTANYDALNEWVYAELFLTPSNDPWLGLAPADVYTALEGDGRVVEAADLASRPGG